MMASKNDEKWMANFEALKAHMAETGHFPNKHTVLNNRTLSKKKDKGWYDAGRPVEFIGIGA